MHYVSLALDLNFLEFCNNIRTNLIYAESNQNLSFELNF